MRLDDDRVPRDRAAARSRTSPSSSTSSCRTRTRSRRSADCSPACSGGCPIPDAIAHVAGLELVAESTAGRRNRIETVLVTREAPAEEPVAEDRPSSRCPARMVRRDPTRADPEDAKLVTLARSARVRSVTGRRAGRRGRSRTRRDRAYLRRRHGRAGPLRLPALHLAVASRAGQRRPLVRGGRRRHG